MRVFIVRHGKAEPFCESGRDADRPLHERGEAQARHLAEQLAAADPRPAAIVCSDAVRAHRTATTIAGGLDLELTTDRRLRVDEPASHALEVIAEHAAAGAGGTLAIVGHNPQLAQVIGVLSGGASAPEVRLRTGEAWELEIDADRPIGSGRVQGVHRLDD